MEMPQMFTGSKIWRHSSPGPLQAAGPDSRASGAFCELCIDLLSLQLLRVENQFCVAFCTKYYFISSAFVNLSSACM